MWPEFQIFYIANEVKLWWHIFLPNQAQIDDIIVSTKLLITWQKFINNCPSDMLVFLKPWLCILNFCALLKHARKLQNFSNSKQCITSKMYYLQKHESSISAMLKYFVTAPVTECSKFGSETATV